MATTYYVTGQDVLTDVLSRADELGITLSDMENEAKRYIQARYVGVVAEGFPWTWARKKPPGVFATAAEITAGSASVTLNSTSVTLSIAPGAVTGRKFFTDDDGIVYRINAVAGAILTLDGAYLGVTNAAAAYHVFQDEVDLAADFLVPFTKRFVRDMQGNWQLDLIGEDELSAKYSYPARRSGVPRYCAFIADKRLRLSPYPLEARRYEYAYIYHPTQALTGGVLPFDNSANDALIIQPPEHRDVVALYAIGHMLVDKDDDRGPGFVQAGDGRLGQLKRHALKQIHPRMWMRPQYRVSTPR